MRTAQRGLWLETRITDPEQDRWGRHLIWRADSDLITLPHAILKNTGAAQAFLEEPAAHGTVAWIGGDDGVVRIELPAAELRPVTFRAVVRQVVNRAGKQLPLAGSAPQLGAAHSELTINYSTDRLGDRSTRFQTRLDGRDDDWSRPTTATAFTAAGLRAGRYTLHIRARDIDGRFSEPAQFSFVVLPPWWETWWAIGAYVLVCALAIVGFIRWRLRTVERRNHELETLIAARTQELRTAKVGAESANQAKSVFLASMSHELRTPLNAILGYSQILRKEIGLSTKGRRQLEIVGRNGEHLLQMINEVLDLAKIEAGKMSLHATEFPLMRVVKTAADIFELRANDKGLTFRLEIGAGLPKIVSSDESKLRQVLFNLLGNAVKFTTHGEVVFAVAREHGAKRREQGYASTTAVASHLPAPASRPDVVRFSVTDTGPGIPADQLQAIFLPFHQAATPSASAQGTGLGLTISQRIVELLGGRIQVESTVGRGSRFWFDLPLREVSIARSSAVPRRICGYRGPRRRVLIADSDETNRAVLRDLLEPLGFIVDEADDASACITQMETNPPDVVLLDPRRSTPGDAESLSLLRALPPERRRPIIAISASVFEFDQQQALAAGCDDFLPKPIHETRLLESLGRVLALEWEFLETAKPLESASAATADDRELPRPEELAALDDLLFAGDVAGLRDRISNALARGEPGSRFLHQLDQLAAAFKTAEIRQKLTEARSHVSRP